MEGLMVKHLNYGVRKKMSLQLDPELVSGHNWKMLADKLDYTYEDILAIESTSGSNTLKLLDDYGVRGDSTLQNLCNQLEAIDRQDTIELLEQALPDIRKAYENEQKSPKWLLLNGNPGHCGHPYNRFFSHPCSSSFDQCPQTDHCYPRGPYAGCHVHSPTAPASGRGRTRVSSSPGAPYSSDTSGKVCNCQPSHAHTPPTYCQPVGQTPGATPGKIQNLPSQQVRQRPKYQHNISVEDNNLVSMVVQHDHSHILDRQHDFRDSQVCPVGVDVPREYPLPLEEGILRGFPHSPDAIPSIMRPVDMDVAAEEEVFTSSDSSCSNQSGKGPMFENPTKLIQKQKSPGQVKCAKSAGKRNNKKQHMNSVSEMSDHTGRGQVAAGRNGSQANQNNNCSLYNGSNQTVDSISGSAVQLGGIMDHRLRGETYPCSRDSSVNHTASHGHSRSASDASLANSSHRHSNHRNYVVGQSPSAHHIHDNNEVLSNSPAAGSRLNSSGKVKLAEVCKGSRKVKVFVTYANESRKHRRWVENLSECLEANGFSSYLDIKQVDELMEDRIHWYDYHFKTADFVLLCVSAMYKQQTESGSVSVSPDDHFSLEDPQQDSIHTTYIYKLMQGEFVRQGSRNKRFIPVLLQGASRDDVPTWLRNTLIYQWPSQYQDLLWMLTRPQDKVGSSRRPPQH